MFQYVIKMKELRRNHMYHEQRQLLGTRELPVWQDVLQFPSNNTQADTLTIPQIVAPVVTESYASTATATATAPTTTTGKGSASVATAVPVSDSDPVSDSLKDMKLKGITEEVQNWSPCGVCSLDTTWSNVLKSDAPRARCTHHCKMCGTVVCTVCSPSGDTLMGEG
jgi:hypothetical protein